ncbi:MAG: YraN family protein [Synergistota bacterium]|nr:YraN family protein [Synergistota bacterium]
MTAPHLEKGKRGEDLACRYLRNLGWSILERNVRFRRGELDIVAKDGDTLVIVEVRFRTTGIIMSPEDSVGPRKLRRLVLAGAAYVEKTGWNGFWRIDLIALTQRKGRLFLNHCRDITGGDVVL